MPSTAYMLAAVGVAALVTFVLRAGPFAIIEPLRSSRLMRDLARWTPGGLMIVLLVCLLRAPAQESASQGLLALGAVALVAGLHCWRANAFLSIFTGTAPYIVAMNVGSF